MLAVTDRYQVLQVDPDAEPEVIRAAYRALALKYHPDVSTGSQDRMAALNDAWGILRDAGARAAFDQAGADAKRKPEGAQAGGQLRDAGADARRSARQAVRQCPRLRAARGLVPRADRRLRP
jgi:molecular chaperone DnaJ